MAETRRCIFCQRPLPRRRWWQWSQLIFEPPPFCLGQTVTCKNLWEQRMRSADAWPES